MRLLSRLTSMLLMLILSQLTIANHLPQSLDGKAMPSLAPMLTKVLPAIVNIVAQGDLPPQHPQLHQTHPQRGPEPPKAAEKFMSAGSGVILDTKKGYIITNAHVVHDAKLITVTLNDGRRFIAKLIGSDTGSDIAVLQIQAHHLHALNLGNSAHLQVGDFVVAIGNPFGLNHSVTSGIVSGLQRANLGIEGFENFIQTDAAINSGNSGGALVDLSGNLVGINTAILTPDGGSVGIGFAIPVNMAHSVMTQLIKYGHVNRGMLGVMVQNLTPALADAFKLSNIKGALVTDISPDTPAAKADLQAGDIITAVDNDTIETASGVRNAIGLHRIGDKLSITIHRKGKVKHVTLHVADPHEVTKLIEKHNHLFAGMDLRNFKSQISGHGIITGVQILNINENSPAWHSQPSLRPGDVIIEVNHQPIADLQALDDIARKHTKSLLLRVLRAGGSFYMVLE
ncbi:MAG: endopeptidase [marine bacterium B5-7]|nr:MAG: endopeptidase [marine bacterium B5-7]